MMLLVPSADLGIFVSTTRNQDVRFFDSVFGTFFDRYFPPSTPLANPTPPAELASRAGRFTGRQVPNRGAWKRATTSEPRCPQLT